MRFNVTLPAQRPCPLAIISELDTNVCAGKIEITNLALTCWSISGSVKPAITRHIWLVIPLQYVGSNSSPDPGARTQRTAMEAWSDEAFEESAKQHLVGPSQNPHVSLKTSQPTYAWFNTGPRWSLICPDVAFVPPASAEHTSEARSQRAVAYSIRPP